MRKLIALPFFILLAYTLQAQAWVKSSQDFPIEQKGSLDNYTLKLPAGFKFEEAADFAYGYVGKATLSLNVDIDLVAAVAGMDMVAYAKSLDDKNLYYMQSGVITNKVIAAAPITINGIKMLEISFNYEEKAPGNEKKGKGYFYLVKAKGDPGLTSNDNDVFVTLLFDYEESKGSAGGYTLHKEILKTIKKTSD